jgi:hypothetical protein
MNVATERSSRADVNGRFPVITMECRAANTAATDPEIANKVIRCQLVSAILRHVGCDT